ncbi:MMPL family transporter [Microbacteriaceae bacterium VKM Ac-2854]|nr:MMPL family transporter [Microbacteriaceae bacterium VKM Ac-2854]
MRAGTFERFTSVAHRLPRTVIALSLLLVLIANGLGAGLAERLLNGGTTDPGSPSARADALVAEFAPAADPDVLLLVTGPAATDAPSTQRAGLALAQRLDAVPDVRGVVPYWSSGSAALRSDDGRSALITAHIDGSESEQFRTLERIETMLAHARGAAATEDLRVELGGFVPVQRAIQDAVQHDLEIAEMIALPITYFLLMLVFGGALASLLPLLVGVFAIVCTNAVLALLADVTDVSIFAMNLTTALGLGLAVDYALLMVRRFREELEEHGTDVRMAVVATIDSAGRTVFFSAVTVAAALAVMLLFPLFFLRSFAYAGIAVVAFAALGAIVVLPALFLLLGRRVRERRSANRPERPFLGLGGRWARWTLLITRRPGIVAVATAVLLLALAAPFLRAAYGPLDDRLLAAGTSERAVAQELRDRFTEAPGVLATIVLPARADPSRVSAMVDEVSGVSGTVISEQERPLVTVLARADLDLASARAQRIAADVRALPLPGGTLVTGEPARQLDTEAAVARTLPTALLLVVGVAAGLVFLLTGSLVLPVLAVLSNALSLTAMLGAVVLVFQDGALAEALKLTPTGFIDVTLPLLMSCIAFGLSMDYGVFLLARLVEERRRGLGARDAMAMTAQRTGGLITSAAAILAVVLIAIGSSGVTSTKMLGLGVALAVIVDATVVRSVLVPSAVVWLGERAWWAPPALRRFHDRWGWRE